MNWGKKFLVVVGAVFALALAYLLARIDWKVLFRRNEGSCAFCGQKVLESQVFYRGERVLGLVTYKPAVRGHVLVMPKRHVVSFEELTKEELSEVQEVVKKVHEAAQQLYGAVGYLLVQKNGREAGQSVPHVHFHYLPRGLGEGPVAIAWRMNVAPWLKPLNSEELARYVNELSATLQRL